MAGSLPPPEVFALGVAQGMGTGLAACGLVLAFRASRALNLAHAAVGALGAVLVAYGVQRWAASYWAMALLAILAGALVGSLLEIGLVRRLRRAPPLMTLVATLGAAQLLLVAAGALQAGLVPGSPVPHPPGVPAADVGHLRLSPGTLSLVVVAPLAVAALWLMLTRTTLGAALRAAADNPEQARALGIPAGRLAALGWGVAGGLSVLTALLVLPSATAGGITASGAGLLLPALAAAAVARMASLPGALLAGCALGVAEQVAIWVAPGSGASQVVVLALVVGVILLRPGPLGRLAPRGSWAAFASAAPLRAPGAVLAMGGATAVAAAVALPGTMLSALTGALCFALLGLSAWIVAAGTGELPLAQGALAGLGAAAAVGAGGGVAGLLVAAAAGTVVAVLVGAAAMRSPGFGLVAVTLAFGAAAQILVIERVLGPGVPLEPVFGGGPRRAALLAAAALCAALWLLHRLARGGPGARVVALRDDRRAAQALGIDPLRTRLLVLAVSGLLAGVTGPLLAGAVPAIAAQAFAPQASIDAVAVAVLGGLGTVAGPVLGAGYVTALPGFVDLPTVALATSAVGWLLLVLYVPGGLSRLLDPLRRPPAPRTSATRGAGRPPLPVAARAASGRLELEGLHRSFGSVAVLAGVDLIVAPGELVAVVGANGAGKTTLLDIVAGTLHPHAGRVLLDGRDITPLPPHRRARAGLARSWQEGVGFDTLTVAEVLRLAGDPAAGALVGLAGLEDARVAELSTGQRRALELGIVLARRPRVLLLDEPSAGLAQGEVAALAGRLRELRDALGMSVLLVEHDIALARDVADRMVRLQGGVAVPEPERVAA